MHQIAKSLIVLFFLTNLTLLSPAASGEAAAPDVADLQKQLAEAQARNLDLQARLKKLEAVAAAEKAQTRDAIVKLEAERAQLQQQLARLQQEAAERAKSAPDAPADTPAGPDVLAALRKQTEALQQELQQAQADRDKNLKSVVELTDQLHQAFNELKRLREANAQLIALLPKPPDKVLEGVVTAVLDNGLVEISLGTDDGLSHGRLLTAYRVSGTAAAPLGAVQVVTVAKDKAVCKIDAASLKSPLKKDDRVTTGKPSLAPPNPAPPNPNEPPHLVDGTVLAVGAEGQVQISFGANDGLKLGHRLDVYRLTGGQGIYIGRLEVVNIESDKSICKSILEFERDTIRPGDRVASKIK